MADEIKIPLVSTYDDEGAKAAIKDAQKLEQLDPTVTVSADTKAADKSVSAFISKLDGIDGETATMVLAVKGADVQRQLADVLADVSRLDATDATIDVKLEQAAALKGDLNQIESKIGEINATPVAVDTTPAAEGLHRVGDEADKSRSVMANMVGNTTQDLSQLGGVAGTAGLALGQFGEYAAEGDISLKGLASTAGPMAGLAVVSMAISKAMQFFSDKAKQAQEDTDAWAAAMAAGGDAATSMAADLSKAGKILADTSDDHVTFGEAVHRSTSLLTEFAGPAREAFNLLTGAHDPVKDITSLLSESGITVEQWTASIAGGAEGMATFRAAVEQSGMSAGDQQKLLNAAANSQDDYAAATTKAAAAAKVFAESSSAQAAKDEAAGWAIAAEQSGNMVDALDAVAGAQADAKKAVEDYTQTLQDQIDAATGAADAVLASSDATIKLQDATANTQKVLADSKSTHDDHVQAINAERDALIDSAKAQSTMADEQAAAAGVTRSATDKVDGYNRSLEDNAKNSTPQAQKAAYDYLIQLNQIPPETATEIQTLVNAGKLAEANALITDASRTRQAAVDVTANTAQAESDIQKLIKTRNLQINAEIIAKGGAGYGSGYGPGAVPSSAAGGVTTVNINMPAGARGVDVVRQVAGQTRRNGRRYGGQQVVNFARR